MYCDQQCADTCLTPGSQVLGRALTCSVHSFLCCQCFHHSQFQAINMMDVTEYGSHEIQQWAPAHHWVTCNRNLTFHLSTSSGKSMARHRISLLYITLNIVSGCPLRLNFWLFKAILVAFLHSCTIGTWSFIKSLYLFFFSRETRIYF